MAYQRSYNRGPEVWQKVQPRQQRGGGQRWYKNAFWILGFACRLNRMAGEKLLILKWLNTEDWKWMLIWLLLLSFEEIILWFILPITVWLNSLLAYCIVCITLISEWQRWSPNGSIQKSLSPPNQLYLEGVSRLYQDVTPPPISQAAVNDPEYKFHVRKELTLGPAVC